MLCDFSFKYRVFPLFGLWCHVLSVSGSVCYFLLPVYIYFESFHNAVTVCSAYFRVHCILGDNSAVIEGVC
jgi:hypothetical protein